MQSRIPNYPQSIHCWTYTFCFSTFSFSLVFQYCSLFFCSNIPSPGVSSSLVSYRPTSHLSFVHMLLLELLELMSCRGLVFSFHNFLQFVLSSFSSYLKSLVFVELYICHWLLLHTIFLVFMFISVANIVLLNMSIKVTSHFNKVAVIYFQIDV